MHKLNCLFTYLGRVFIAVIFLFGAFGAFTSYEGMHAYMASKGLTYIPVLLYITAVIQLLGGLSLVVGYRVKYAATALFLILIPITYFMHDFWNLTGADQKDQIMHFLSNLAIGGGLLLIIGGTSSKCSADIK